ncbi:hypothetical protein F441_02271 [Phytophthora nicotianae CJ01A1]|uniref:Uncharacterized protein n=1 Tax=Phytophthora nicotianae CJ01A1 TaxID=1317063 RepID=W2XQL6_PHYNI|nr:hypothetical protein F441_02271 [Phytophthora nicotianae CJ01A1]
MTTSVTMKTLKTTEFVVKTAEAVIFSASSSPTSVMTRPTYSTPLAATVPMIRVAVSHDMVSFSTSCV